MTGRPLPQRIPRRMSEAEVIRAGEPANEARQPGCLPGPVAGLTVVALVSCRLGGCRHRECRQATAAHLQTVPAVPAAGTRRRLRALARTGWPTEAMAGRLDLAVPVGVAERALARVQTAQPRAVPVVPPWFATAVSALYDEVWDVPGGSLNAVAFATRRGWAPPMAWDDNPGDPHCIDDPDAPVSDWKRRGAGRRHSLGLDDLRVLADGDLAGGGRFGSLNALAGHLAERTGMSASLITKMITRARQAAACKAGERAAS